MILTLHSLLHTLSTPRFYMMLCIGLIGQQASAQISVELNTDPYTKKPKAAEIRPLNWMNEQFLIRQRKKANALVREEFGRQLYRKRNDLSLIQRLINEDKLKNANKDLLQALGVALGDIFENEHKKIHWRVYKDNYEGRETQSHAVCIEKTQHCVFPITMISRRMEAGLKPELAIIYQRVFDSLKPYLPKYTYKE